MKWCIVEFVEKSEYEREKKRRDGGEIKTNVKFYLI